jgi:hypothetical protein
VHLSGKQLVIGSAALILVSFGAAFAIFQLTGGDDQIVAQLTENQRVAACNVWDAGALAAARTRAVELSTRNADVAIFLDPNVSATQRTDVETFIKAQRDVASVVYESKDVAYRLFIELFADEADIVASTTPEGLPESFRVVLRSKDEFAAFRYAIERRTGVNKVRDDRQPAQIHFEGPLYLIRKQGFYVDPVGKRVHEPPGCT